MTIMINEQPRAIVIPMDVLKRQDITAQSKFLYGYIYTVGQTQWLTPTDAMRALTMPERTVYRALVLLCRLGLVKKVGPRAQGKYCIVQAKRS